MIENTHMRHSDQQHSTNRSTVAEVFGTRIWQFVVISPRAKNSHDCNICSHCLIESDVVIDERVSFKSGVRLWDSLRAGNDVFIGPNVAFTDDRFPCNKQYPQHFAKTIVMAGASIWGGSGATSWNSNWDSRHGGDGRDHRWQPNACRGVRRGQP